MGPKEILWTPECADITPFIRGMSRLCFILQDVIGKCSSRLNVFRKELRNEKPALSGVVQLTKIPYEDIRKESTYEVAARFPVSRSKNLA
jgi:hypothetical protein